MITELGIQSFVWLNPALGIACLSSKREKDMGDGDQWPAIRDKVLAADILIFATPTWMGQTSSVGQRVLERLDAELAETDDENRPILLGKVALVAVVGNEDGAHHIALSTLRGPRSETDTSLTVASCPP